MADHTYNISLTEALLLNFTRRPDGSIRTRPEIAAAMIEAGYTVDDVQVLMAFESRQKAREAISQGLGRLYPARPGGGTNAYHNSPWTPEAVEVLKAYYPVGRIPMKVVVEAVNERASGPLTKNAIVGKAHRLGLARDKNLSFEGETSVRQPEPGE